MKFFNKVYKIIAGFIFFMNATGLMAQVDVLKVSRNIQAAYKQTPFISYSVQYSYSPQNNPSDIQFAGKGSYKINGENFWGIMDNMEYMQNDSYFITVFKEKHLMNISKANTIYPELSTAAVFDSMVKIKNISYSLRAKGSVNQVFFDFSKTQGFQYKSFSLSYDTATFFIKEISYLMRDENINEENEPAAANESPFVVVTATYSDYSTRPFDKNVFNPQNYFRETNKNYIPQNQYEGFEIFIGSPEFLKD